MLAVLEYKNKIRAYTCRPMTYKNDLFRHAEASIIIHGQSWNILHHCYCDVTLTQRQSFWEEQFPDEWLLFIRKMKHSIQLELRSASIERGIQSTPQHVRIGFIRKFFIVAHSDSKYCKDLKECPPEDYMEKYLSLIYWDRGKQCVLWLQQRRSRGHKTHCFPKVSVNKCFVI
jgi:hypothetical protein